jgi:hypothetical protein
MTQVQAQKLQLLEQIAQLSNPKQIAAMAAHLEELKKDEANPKRKSTLSPELEEELRLGDDDIAAGRVSTLEETMEAMREGIRMGAEARARRHAKAA